jgi:hypothetical protein
MLQDVPLLSPGKIGTDGAATFGDAVEGGLLAPDPVHYVTKHLQQGIESDHFRVKKNIQKSAGSVRSIQPENLSPVLKPCCG